MSKLIGEHIVFIPGIDGTGISFEPIIAILPKGVYYTVVSYPQNEYSSFEDIVDYIASQIPSNDSIVIAESFGGPIAVTLIASKRIKAKALILSATFALPPRPLLLKLCRILPVSFLLKVFFRRSFLRLILERSELADILFCLWQRVKSDVILKAVVHRLSLVRDINVTELLPEITIPCCYIQASDDKTIPPSALLVFEKGIAHLKVRKVKGPHFILSASPDRCLEIIEEFLLDISSIN